MEHKPNILVVDDESIHVNLISQILSPNYNIKIANRGQKALKAIEKFEIDLILLDIQMPQMDGFEVATIIRSQSQYNHIPIIFLTAQANEEFVVKGFDIGANDYLTKPFNHKELKARVETHLQVHQLQKFLEMMINLQPSITLFSDGKEGKFINQTGLDFLGYTNSKEFFEEHICICEYFVKFNECFYFDNNLGKKSWINRILTLDSQHRNVAMFSKDRERRVFHVSIKTIPNASMYIIEFTDITERYTEENRLKDEAMHDQLTAIYNRNYFEKHINDFIQKSKNSDETLAIAFLDIDHFKQVNDTYGHDVGDDVLKEFTALIKQNISSDELFVRWGGEEFIVVFMAQNSTLAQSKIEKLKALIEYHIFKRVEKITCSIGVTIYHQDEDIDQSIKRADDALYKAKNSGRNQVVFIV